MTGMPAFGSTHSDEQIWNIVGFVRRLPQISPDDFRAMGSKFGSAASTKTKVISKEKTTGDVILVKWRSIQRRISGVPTSEPARLRTGFARIDPRDGRLIASGEGERVTRAGCTQRRAFLAAGQGDGLGDDACGLATALTVSASPGLVPRLVPNPDRTRSASLHPLRCL
jgi:hypothetical protein